MSCARCSAPQRSPQRPRGKKWNAGATATGRTTPSRPARRSRPLGTAGSHQETVIPRQQRRGLSGRDFRPPGNTDDPKSQARPARDRRRAFRRAGGDGEVCDSARAANAPSLSRSSHVVGRAICLLSSWNASIAATSHLDREVPLGAGNCISSSSRREEEQFRCR